MPLLHSSSGLLSISQISTISGHGQNGTDFLSFFILREGVDQYSSASPYRLLISQFIMGACTISGKSVVENSVPESIMKLTEVAFFNPTQPVRDQGNGCNVIS